MGTREGLRLISDMDGVIAHSQAPIIDTFNRRFGTSLTYADWKTFNLLTLEAVRLSGESTATVAAWLYSEEVMRNSDVVPGTADAVRELASMGTPPVIVTSRPPAQASMTRDWVRSRLPEIRDVHVRDNGYLGMKGDQFKIAMIGHLGAGLYIDDDPSVIEEVQRFVSEGGLSLLRAAVLVDRPWNDTYAASGIVHRVGNWRTEDYGWDGIVQIALDLSKTK